MSKSPARVVNDRVVFGDAVTNIAEALNPIGTAGRILAETYAMAAEMRRISLEKNQSADDKEVALAVLEQRQRESSATLRQKQRELGSAEVSLKGLREGIIGLQRASIKPGLSPEVLALYRDMAKDLTEQILQHHKDQGGESTISLDRLLNGPGAVALAESLRRPAKSAQQEGGRGRGRRP